MAKLVLENVQIKNDSETDIIAGDNINDYKGYFHNEEEPEERYYEWGAHFPYQLVYNRLESFKKTLSPVRLEADTKPFRKVQENKPKTNITRNTLFNKHNLMMKLKQTPLNVTENTGCASLIVNNIKSRNQDIYKPIEQAPQTNIVKISYSKKLTYKHNTKKTDKSGVNIYTSYNDTFCHNLFSKNSSNSKNKGLENKLHPEKGNPVMLIAKSKADNKDIKTTTKKIDLKYAKNIITTYNTKVRASPSQSTSTKKTDTKRQSDKTTTTTNKPSDQYRYMTASIDKMDDKEDLGLKIISSKNIGTPNKATSIKLGKTSDGDKIDISNATKSFEVNMKPLNDLINLNNKSRNVRNNLIKTRSSLFNSEKVNSQYSASYNNKNQMYTQIVAKSGIANKPNSKASNSKSRITSTTKKSPKVQVNLSQKSYQSNSIRTSQKAIPIKDNVDKQIEIPLHTTSGEDPQRTTAKSNFCVFLNKNLQKNTQAKESKSNKIIIDSSKLKTKSNSVTSNVSNGVNNSNNSKTTLSKNKVTNVSYLKKNEYTCVKNDYTTLQSK